jgi:uncharacterized surface protein with fasciclin (FAS1) repeats
MSLSRFKNAQNAEPSVKSDRRATLPVSFSYVMSAGSTSVTSERNSASRATEAFVGDVEDGAAELVGVAVVVLAMVVGPTFALQINAPATTITSASAHALGRSHWEREREFTVFAITYSARLTSTSWL